MTTADQNDLALRGQTGRATGNEHVARVATSSDRALCVELGFSTRTAAQKINEDCHGIITPHEEPEAASRGIALAIADGASANGSGRIASEIAVTTLLRDFFATPAAWNVSQAIDRVLSSINDWLLAHNSRHPEVEGAVTTLSMLLLRGSAYYLAHVGDTRVYRKRGAVMRQLTIDHTWPRRDMRHVLKRALGLDSHLVVDFADGELLLGDAFVMVSDGVWEVLGDAVMRDIVDSGLPPQALAEALTEHSMRNQVKYMGRNDATALVAAVQRCRC